MESLCLDIMNSNRFGRYLAKTGRDMLEDEKWLCELMEKWGLDADLPIKQHERRALDDLRRNMQQAAKYFKSEPTLFSRALSEINELLQKTPCQVRLVNDGTAFSIQETPECKGWAYVIWSAAFSFAKMMSEHDPTRIKVCENKDCGWIFYDESKSRTRRWCDDKICGNLMKVRRFRERHNITKQLPKDKGGLGNGTS